MKISLRSTLLVIGGAVVGAAISTTCLYLIIFKPVVTSFSHSGYLSQIAEAKLAVVELNMLRKGEHSKLQLLLESRLDSFLVGAEQLQTLDQSWRDQKVEADLQFVRSYLSKYPPSNSYSPEVGKPLQSIPADPESGSSAVAPNPSFNGTPNGAR